MTNRIAIVTGGLTGIGLASAKALQKQGHKVAVGSRRGTTDAETADKVRNELGCEAYLGKLDVCNDDSVNEFLGNVTQRLGKPTILVNSHGIFHEANLCGHPDKEWFEQIDINLNGVFRMVRAVFPGMISENYGRIVNVSSTAGHVGAEGYAAYCASKAGVIGLSKAISMEGAPHNITCVSVSPTYIETPMMDKAIDRMGEATGNTPDVMKEKLKNTNPQGRLVQADEVGNLIAFCCSDASPALTNEDIQINAGALW